MLLAPLLAASVAVSVAESRRGQTGRELMREKLAASQKVLEGLALEDFDLVARQSARLSAMSQSAEWRTLGGPEYEQQTLLFRRQADALNRAARERSLDASTLAYVRLTMSCVDCHKFLRGKLSPQGARGTSESNP